MKSSAPLRPKTPAPDDRYHPGELIHDKYQLVRQLGQGGMGTVWVARNVVLEVSVAIKLITLGGQHDTDETAERLLREARASARLDHPAIVRVFDFGRTSHGDPFIVMELLHGESMADLLYRDSRMTAVQAVRAMLPIAEALASAHDKGVVHRDVKPENVILATTEDGRVQPKLLDFGIASLQEHSTRITQEKRLTREGSVVGTPAYMSPEQAMGKDDLDQRTDIWSFGVMLYELITGRLPFDADNYNALLYEIIHRPPEPCTVHAAGDEELWQILEVALRKRSEERWGSMRAFGEALALWLVDQGVREDICAASLRTGWLVSGTAAEIVEGPPSSDPLLPPNSHNTPRALPLPSLPPKRSPKDSGTRMRQRWPVRVLFVSACFAAGLLTVGGWLSSGQARGQSQPARAGEASREPSTPHTTSAAPVTDRVRAQNEDAALPVDEALGEIESTPKAAASRPVQRKARPRHVAASRAKSPQKPNPNRKQIDFGF